MTPTVLFNKRAIVNNIVRTSLLIKFITNKNGQPGFINFDQQD